MIAIKVFENVILNNIDITWSTLQDASFSLQESTKFSRFEKFKDLTNLINKDISDLIIECFDRNKSCQKCHLDNIDFYDQPSRMHPSPSRSRQNFQIKKIQISDKSDTDISDLIIECSGRDESCQKWYFNNLYLVDKLPHLDRSPCGSRQSWPNSQIWWYFRSCTVLLDLTGDCFNRNEWCKQCYL